MLTEWLNQSIIPAGFQTSNDTQVSKSRWKFICMSCVHLGRDLFSSPAAPLLSAGDSFCALASQIPPCHSSVVDCLRPSGSSVFSVRPVIKLIQPQFDITVSTLTFYLRLPVGLCGCCVVVCVIQLLLLLLLIQSSLPGNIKTAPGHVCVYCKKCTHLLV